MAATTLLLLLTLLALTPKHPIIITTTATASPQPAKCPSSCGDLAIPYPFGIGTGCFRDGFEITCRMMNTSTERNYVATLAGTTVRIVDVSLETAEVQVQLPIGWQCYNESGVEDYFTAEVDFNPKGVYRISNTHNLFVAIGCNTVAYIQSQRDSSGQYSYDYYTGCIAYCNDTGSITEGSCSGVGCCQVAIPSGLTDNSVTFSGYSHKKILSFNPCDYAFLVDKEWFKFGKSNLTMSRNISVPVRLNWALRESTNCAQAQKSPNHEAYGCRSTNSECFDSVVGQGYLCKCSNGYRGNPYLVNGCTDINECEVPDEYPCHGICHNKEGSYDCKCGAGKHGNPFNNSCRAKFPMRERLAVGISASTVSLLLIALSMIIVFQKRRLRRDRKLFFEKNGGIILYQNLMSQKIDTMKIFTYEELEKITDHFSTVIGHGGQGKVYKGKLEDNREVAVKKCIVVDDDKLKQEFVNEMIILSQINHKNVVRLLGCCLQLDVPMLVYEYVPKGTLNTFLHDNELPVSLETRLQICAESAKALAHLHSETVRPILHGDVKSANILLANNCMAKVSDFGTSRFLSMDETQFATYVKGTFGYLDPEFLQHQRLTEKSDVYSFGVVMLELITRKRAVYYDENNEKKCLYNSFLSAMRENRAEEMFDKDIKTEENLEMLVKVSKLAEKCLRPNGENRPTMTEVAEQLKRFGMTLRGIRGSDATTEFFTVSMGRLRDSDSAALLNSQP